MLGDHGSYPIVGRGCLRIWTFCNVDLFSLDDIEASVGLSLEAGGSLDMTIASLSIVDSLEAIQEFVAELCTRCSRSNVGGNTL